MTQKPYRIIGIARENESPENPGALEKRVAIVPADVPKLLKEGCKVYVEAGAGEGIGFSDQEYIDAGAEIQDFEEIYAGKDLVIKFKGPSLEAVGLMDPGTTLFCMAHIASFPDRARLIGQRKITTVAMEEILESPKILSHEIVLGKTAMKDCLRNVGVAIHRLNVAVVGYSSRMMGAIRRASNRNPQTMTIYAESTPFEILKRLPEETLFLYDSVWKNGKQVSPVAATEIQDSSLRFYDLKTFEEERGNQAIKRYRDTHPPYQFGLRRIQCLHETGRAGARYGVQLMEQHGKVQAKDAKILVFGYGNTGMGAIDELSRQGARAIHVLGRGHTQKGMVEEYLEGADLIVNGAEQPAQMRGKNFLLSRDQVRRHLKKDCVVIDLIGGSPTNRSPVENVMECTFLTNPHFQEDGVWFSALWGWPMMGFMRETALRYSSQIVDVLIGYERMIDGLEHPVPGLKRAIVS